MQKLNKLYDNPKAQETLSLMTEYFDCYTKYYTLNDFKDKINKFEQAINTTTYADVFENNKNENAEDKEYIPDPEEIAEERCSHLEKDFTQEQKDYISSYYYYQIENGKQAFEMLSMFIVVMTCSELKRDLENIEDNTSKDLSHSYSVCKRYLGHETQWPNSEIHQGLLELIGKAREKLEINQDDLL